MQRFAIPYVLLLTNIYNNGCRRLKPSGNIGEDPQEVLWVYQGQKGDAECLIVGLWFRPITAGIV